MRGRGSHGRLTRKSIFEKERDKKGKKGRRKKKKKKEGKKKTPAELLLSQWSRDSKCHLQKQSSGYILQHMWPSNCATVALQREAFTATDAAFSCQEKAVIQLPMSMLRSSNEGQFIQPSSLLPPSESLFRGGRDGAFRWVRYYLYHYSHHSQYYHHPYLYQILIPIIIINTITPNTLSLYYHKYFHCYHYHHINILAIIIIVVNNIANTAI